VKSDPRFIALREEILRVIHASPAGMQAAA
jgi:hypothetical protein